MNIKLFEEFYKLDDEYYIASFLEIAMRNIQSLTEKYYKCDQLEGVIELIKSLDFN